MIRIAAVDDDGAQLSQIKEYAGKYSALSEEAVEVTGFLNATDFLTDYRAEYDAVLLDIEMPYLNGMTAAEKLREIDPYIIIVFITNMQKYAVKGYSVNALDFMIKPVREFDFMQMMKKVTHIIKNKEEKEIAVSMGGNMRKIPVSHILYIEVRRHRLTYHTEEGDVEGWGNLNALEKELPADMFSRCNSCYLVSLRHVKMVDGDDVYLGGDVLKISRSRKKGFKAELAVYLGKR